jgi:hypothetical protein
MNGKAGSAEPTTPRPWPPNAQPTVAEFAEWLLICTVEERERFVTHAFSAGDESRVCFERDHAGRIEHADRERDIVQADLRQIMAALGIADYARPYSSHEVVRREVIPAIASLRVAARSGSSAWPADFISDYSQADYDLDNGPQS